MINFRGRKHTKEGKKSSLKGMLYSFKKCLQIQFLKLIKLTEKGKSIVFVHKEK